MSSNFSSHELIHFLSLDVFYKRTHFTQYFSDLTNSKEFETMKLLKNIFNKMLFNNMNDVIINSQQSSDLSSKKRCDLVIKYFEQNIYISKIFCFVECKRTSSTQSYKLKDLKL